MKTLITPIRAIALIVAVAASFMLAACGSGGDGGGYRGTSDGAVVSDVPSAEADLDVLLGDCSSFRDRGYLASFLDSMVEVAKSSAAMRRNLSYACFDAAPERTLRFDTVNFFDAPEAIKDDDYVVARAMEAKALGTRKRFAQMIQQPQEVPGSNPLAALEMAAQSRVRRVFMFSDGLIDSRDLPRLKTMSEAELGQAASDWGKAMSGLRGATIYIVGAGRGVSSVELVAASRRLFELTLEKAGADLVWADSLPDLSSTGGDRA